MSDKIIVLAIFACFSLTLFLPNLSSAYNPGVQSAPFGFQLPQISISQTGFYNILGGLQKVVSQFAGTGKLNIAGGGEPVNIINSFFQLWIKWLEDFIKTFMSYQK